MREHLEALCRGVEKRHWRMKRFGLSEKTTAKNILVYLHGWKNKRKNIAKDERDVVNKLIREYSKKI